MKKIIVLLFIICCGTLLFSQTVSDALLPGLEAYSREDWDAAVMFFKKLSADKVTVSDDSVYWLVMSELSAGDYKSALADANSFLAKYKESKRLPDIRYQKGRALYQLKQYDEAVRQLYDFVKEYPDHKLIPSALYWIAESLFDTKNYERASLFYTMIIDDYKDSPKYEASFYRLSLINQKEREEELLELLKVTHEESLRAAEEYEKKSQKYEQAILAYQNRIRELEAQLNK